MLAHAMPTNWEWAVLLTIWNAWLWVPVVFTAIVLWRKEVSRTVVVCFAIVEIAAIFMWMSS